MMWTFHMSRSTWKWCRWLTRGRGRACSNWPSVQCKKRTHCGPLFSLSLHARGHQRLCLVSALTNRPKRICTSFRLLMPFSEWYKRLESVQEKVLNLKADSEGEATISSEISSGVHPTSLYASTGKPSNCPARKNALPHNSRWNSLSLLVRQFLMDQNVI